MNNFEKRIGAELKRAKAKFEFEPVRVPYTIHAYYVPDFVLETKKGTVYIEAKGYFRPEHKRKMAAVKKCNPDLDIRILFFKYNKQNEKWAIKHGFPYAFETIPKPWLKGALI